jgi:flagellar basal-body rod protein FlgC
MISILTGIDSTASALEAERTRMDVVAQNISNAGLTHGLDGKPYQRQQVVFESVLRAQQSGDSFNSGPQTVEVARIEKDNRPPRMIYNPGSPDADSHGMVAVPDINIHQEMVDMIAASRSYDANIAVVKNAHAIAMQALSIGKH